MDKLREPAGQCRAAAGQTASLPSSGRETRCQHSNSMQSVSAQRWSETTGFLLSEDAVLTCALSPPSPPRAKRRESVVPHPNSHCGIDGDTGKISSQLDDLGRQAAPAYPKLMTLPMAVSFGFCESSSCFDDTIRLGSWPVYGQRIPVVAGGAEATRKTTRHEWPDAFTMMSRLAFASYIQNAPSCR